MGMKGDLEKINTAPGAQPSTEKMWSDLEKQYQQGLIYNMPDQRKGLK